MKNDNLVLLLCDRALITVCFNRDGPNGEVAATGQRLQRAADAPRPDGLHAPARPHVAHAPGRAAARRLHHQGTAHAQHGGARQVNIIILNRT